MKNVYEPPSELTEEEENILESKLVWILGANRSGTTWLGRQLELDDNFLMNEPLIGEHLGISFLRMNELVREHDVNKNRDDYFFSEKYKNEWRFYLRKLVLNRIYSQFKNISKNVIIKEPNGSVGSDIISEFIPNSKIIILLRDPRDIIDSRLDALSEEGWSAKKGWIAISEKNRIEFIKREALKWVQLVKVLMKVYENHQKNNRIILKYEELRVNTFEVLQKIFNFIDSNMDEKKIKKIIDTLSFEKIPSKEKGAGKRKRIAKPGKWREQFNQEEIEKLNQIMGETMKNLGYSIG